MHVVVLKMALGAVAVAAAVVAAFTMLSLLGRTSPPGNPGRLRALHRVAGYVFAVSVVGLTVTGLLILARQGESLSIRGVLHWTVGALVVIVAAVKIVMVRYYKKFLKAAPGVGVLTLVLVLLAAALSGVFVLAAGPPGWVEVGAGGDVIDVSVRAAEPPVQPADPAVPADPPTGVDAGRVIFERNCLHCHGPSARGAHQLAGLFGRERLRSSGRPVTRENVRSQILDPVGGMPSFRGRLNDSEISALLDYLETL